VKHNLLDCEPIRDWAWAAGAWAHVGPAAQQARENSSVSVLYENFEALAAP
jgi:hypothetical protein